MRMDKNHVIHKDIGAKVTVINNKSYVEVIKIQDLREILLWLSRPIFTVTTWRKLTRKECMLSYLHWMTFQSKWASAEVFFLNITVLLISYQQKTVFIENVFSMNKLHVSSVVFFPIETSFDSIAHLFTFNK